MDTNIYLIESLNHKFHHNDVKFIGSFLYLSFIQIRCNSLMKNCGFIHVFLMYSFLFFLVSYHSLITYALVNPVIFSIYFLPCLHKCRCHTVNFSIHVQFCFVFWVVILHLIKVKYLTILLILVRSKVHTTLAATFVIVWLIGCAAKKKRIFILEADVKKFFFL